MEHNFDLIRLVGDERRVGHSLESVSKHWQKDKESFLFISPHDDDVVLGGGLLMQLAIHENIPVYVIIVTNGAMGYCAAEDKATISAIRKEETKRSFAKLGIPEENLFWLNFPDCSLATCQGRREPLNGDKENTIIEGFTGLQNSFTYYLRKLKPTQCFIPTFNDLHPDHKYTYSEFLISIFHASGTIWPELGEPIQEVPHINEMAVYCDFDKSPHLRLVAKESYFDKKLESILEFKSQTQIQSLVDSIKENGSVEFFKNVYFNLYNPHKYHHDFNAKSGFFNKNFML